MYRKSHAARSGSEYHAQRPVQVAGGAGVVVTGVQGVDTVAQSSPTPDGSGQGHDAAHGLLIRFQ